MTKDQYFLDGKSLSLGKKIGRGGEGEVYLASNDPRVAVKIYTDPPNSQRQAKVISMVESKIASKSTLVSFPKGIVKTKDGAFAGFTMNLVNGHRALHEVYSPRDRRVKFPTADYRFLIRAAANVARAVGQVHQATCVIGDINHSGILVSKDATVAIIDADSFQFESNGNVFPCLVGVPEYTPPELQGKSLKDVVRTTDHDNFGLAVAIFQLLFMGRHPYAGQHPEPNLSLEQAIKRNLFAYSRLHKTQKPPPGGVMTLDDFSSDVANTFESAFGVDYLSRPGAAQWIDILRTLEAQLSRCEINSMHYFPSAGKNCPWCRMEDESGVMLFVVSFKPSSPVNSATSNLNFEKIWSDIQRISLPQMSSMHPKLANLSGTAPSQDAQKANTPFGAQRKLASFGILTLVILWCCAPNLFIIWLFILVPCVAHLFSSESRVDKSSWVERFYKADKAFNDELNAWRQRSGVAKLFDIRSNMDGVASEFRSLSMYKSQELSKLVKDQRHTQLMGYLDRHVLTKEKVPGIGQSKKAILASFRIKTAADIDKAAIMSIPGFGEATADKLLSWRSNYERKFVYNPNSTSIQHPAHIKIEHEYRLKANELLKRLSSGCAELQQGLIHVQSRINSGDQRLNQLATVRAQIETDLKHLGIPIPSSVCNPTISPIMPSNSSTNPAQGYTITAPTINSPKCPRCSSIMVRRIARRGRNRGNSFWGCSTYPRCRGIRP